MVMSNKISWKLAVFLAPAMFISSYASAQVSSLGMAQVEPIAQAQIESLIPAQLDALIDVKCVVSGALEGEAQLTLFCKGSEFGFLIEDTRTFTADQLATVADARRYGSLLKFSMNSHGKILGITPAPVTTAAGQAEADRTLSKLPIAAKNQIFTMTQDAALTTFNAAAPVPATITYEGQQLSYRFSQSQVLFLQRRWSVDASKLVNIYSKRNYEPIWFQQGMFSLENYAVLEEILKSADRHGLIVEDYLSADILNLISLANNSQKYDLEILLTDALVRFLNDVSSGRFSHRQIDTDMRFAAKKFTDWAGLNMMINTSLATLHIYAETQAPQAPRYQRLKYFLAKLKEYKASNSWKPIAPPKTEVTVGMAHPVVIQIRARLSQLGYLNQLDSDIFDEELLLFLNQWQSENNLPTTTVLTGYGKLPKTPLDGLDPMRELFGSLSVGIDTRINRVIANMEKFRWLPQDLGNDYIFVNLAAQYLKVYSGTTMPMQMKTMNGTIMKRTPQMRTMMTDIQFNPRWNPTPNIVMEKIKVLRGDPKYFSRIRMRVSYGGRWLTVPELLAFSDLQIRQMAGSKLNFQQEPGPENALGVLRFNLENNDMIYMHDTNERKDFTTRMNRMVSSGCIRLEKPYQMAEYVLNATGAWPIQTIYDKTAKGIEGEKFDVAFKVNLPTKIPVYTLFQTAEVTEAGHLLFFADSYGQDQRILSAVNQKGAADETF